MLPPESSSEADRLIHALIQSQSVFLKSPHPVVRDFFSSALSEKFDAKTAAVLTQAFPSTGWTSETLEALVDYSAQRSMVEEPRLPEVFQGYNVTTTDWKFVEQIFMKAREQLLKQGKQVAYGVCRPTCVHAGCSTNPLKEAGAAGGNPVLVALVGWVSRRRNPTPQSCISSTRPARVGLRSANPTYAGSMRIKHRGSPTMAVG